MRSYSHPYILPPITNAILSLIASSINYCIQMAIKIPSFHSHTGHPSQLPHLSPQLRWVKSKQPPSVESVREALEPPWLHLSSGGCSWQRAQVILKLSLVLSFCKQDFGQLFMGGTTIMQKSTYSALSKIFNKKQNS